MKHSRRPGVAPINSNLFFVMKKIITTAILAVSLAATISFADPTGTTPAPAPNEIDYVSQLPNPNDLVSKGVPDGARVSKITQTGSEITTTYSYSNGQVRVVSYRLLPAAGSSAATGNTPIPTVTMTAVPTPTTPAPVPVYYDSTSPTTVVYQQPAPVYYYPAYDYGYYPWYPPVSVRLGFGFRDGFGGFRGGFRGGFHR